MNTQRKRPELHTEEYRVATMVRQGFLSLHQGQRLLIEIEAEAEKLKLKQPMTPSWSAALRKLLGK